MIMLLACIGACLPAAHELDEQPVSAPGQPVLAGAPTVAARDADLHEPDEHATAHGAHEAPEEVFSGPGRKRLGAAVTLNRTCEECHTEEAREWRRSHHRQSNTNPAYRRALAVEPLSFCRQCHAPESDPAKEPPAAVSALGVGCVTCHVTEEGLVLAGSGKDDSPVPPHPVRRSAAFAGPPGCGGCHEFRFPSTFGDDDRLFMQTTVREHRRSAASGQTCASCHMPLVNGRRSHAFAEVRDPGWLQARLLASAERVAEGRLRITLVQTEAGHAFPTGDLFRRLEVGCELRGPTGTVLVRTVRHLARHSEITPSTRGREIVRDDRVLGEPVAIDLDVSSEHPVPRDAQLFWWVRYQRVATVGSGRDEREVKIESEVPLHAGALAWNSL